MQAHRQNLFSCVIPVIVVFCIKYFCPHSEKSSTNIDFNDEKFVRDLLKMESHEKPL